jgi:hypothetical protein
MSSSFLPAIEFRRFSGANERYSGGRRRRCFKIRHLPDEHASTRQDRFIRVSGSSVVEECTSGRRSFDGDASGVAQQPVNGRHPPSTEQANSSLLDEQLKRSFSAPLWSLPYRTNAEHENPMRWNHRLVFPSGKDSLLSSPDF